MAQPSLKAEFFVSPDGLCVAKAPPLKRSEGRAVFERDGQKCRLCCRRVTWGRAYLWPVEGDAPAAVDHVFPRARGGQNDAGNLQLLCEPCNAQKGNKTMDELAVYLAKIRRRQEARRGAY